jgi:hypothetical protein
MKSTIELKNLELNLSLGTYGVDDFGETLGKHFPVKPAY